MVLKFCFRDQKLNRKMEQSALAAFMVEFFHGVNIGIVYSDKGTL